MFQLSLVTPEKKLLTDVEVDAVIVPAAEGEMTLLPGHAPLISTLNVGILRYRLAGEKEFNLVAISWGYCEVHPKGITILAETAETKDEIDRERAEAARKKAEGKLFEASLQPDQIDKFQRKVARARARIALVDGKIH